MEQTKTKRRRFKRKPAWRAEQQRQKIERQKRAGEKRALLLGRREATAELEGEIVGYLPGAVLKSRHEGKLLDLLDFAHLVMQGYEPTKTTWFLIRPQDRCRRNTPGSIEYQPVKRFLHFASEIGLPIGTEIVEGRGVNELRFTLNARRLHARCNQLLDGLRFGEREAKRRAVAEAAEARVVAEDEVKSHVESGESNVLSLDEINRRAAEIRFARKAG